MKIPPGFQFTTIYDIRWEGLFDYPDFYIFIYRCDHCKDQMILDSEGKILACTDVLDVTKFKRHCDSKYSLYPSPLYSFPHVKETGKLVSGDAVQVLIGPAIEEILSTECDPTDNLCEVLSVVDEVLIVLTCDHRGVSYGESSFVAQMEAVRTAIVQSGIISDAFVGDGPRLEFVMDLKLVLHYIMSRIRIVS